MRAAWGLVIAIAGGSLVGCKTTPEAAAPKMEQQRITNIGYFDLKNCWPGQAELPKPITKEALVGFLVSSRPEFNECFVDPANRGPADITRAVISVTVNEQGPTYDVQGENLTPTGTECVKKVLTTRGNIEPVAAGGQPVQAQIDFQHKVGVSPAVKMGVNEASDATGAVRLAMPQWCDCFEPWKTKAPHSFDGSMELAKTSPTPTAVTFPPSQDAEAQQVQACVSEKLKAAQIPHKSEQLKVPVRVLLIHSGVNESLPASVPPDLQFIQLEALRAQRASDVAVALGARAAEGQEWDKLVTDYKTQAEAAKKTKKSPSITVKQLKDACAELIAADDAWIAALEKQAENEQRTLEFAQGQVAADPGWNEVVTAATSQVQAAQNDLGVAKKTREEDNAACPKTKY